MKYKIYGVTTVIIALFISFYADNISSNNVSGRYHQHKYKKEFNLKSSDKDNFISHLPIVIIETEGKAIPGNPINESHNNIKKYTTTDDGEKMVYGNIKIIDNSDIYNRISDEPKIDVGTKIRVRGNSSRHFPKKNYLLRFEEDNKYVNKKVMGMNPHYEWSLHGPYLDKTLIRNYMWYNISGEIMEFAPDVRFCEAFINGEYKGLYLMTETVSSGEENSRINLKKEDSSSNATSYILRLDRGSTVERKNIKILLNNLEINEQILDIKFPKYNNLTNGKIEYIVNDFSKFEKSLFSYDYDTRRYGYWHDIDVKNFVDYYIINEFSGNLDSGVYSTFIYKTLGGKLKKVVWDFNSSCDNYVETKDSGELLHPEKNIWDSMLFKDEKFTDLVINRYRELRKSYLSDDYLLNYIDKTIDYLDDAVDRNFEVWRDSFDEDLLIPEDRNIHSYDEAVDQLKTYIINRGIWMDEHIETLKQYSHESKVKQYNH